MTQTASSITPETKPLVAPRRVIRARMLTRLRWFAIAGQVLVTLGVRVVLGYELPVGPVLLAIAVGVWVNLYQNFAQPPAQPLDDRSLTAFLIFDTLQIASVLFLTGGIQNPFAIWLVLPAMLASASLPRRRAVVVLGTVVVALTVVALFHYPLPWIVPDGYERNRVYDLGTWAALMLGVGFVSVYAYQVASDQLKLGSALEAAEQVLAREERLTALGGLAAAAAHELGTPLATIQVTAKEMVHDLPEGPIREDAELLVSQTQRCQSILKRLANSGDNPDITATVLSLEEVLREAAKPFLNEPDKNVEIAFDEACHSLPPQRLRRLGEVIYGLRTLVENAVKYADETIRMTARWSDDELSILIEDDGPGFAPDVLARLGEPYPRTDASKPDGKQGLGLGFFIAKTLLERTGARMRYGNNADHAGAFIDVSWPLANLRAGPISNPSSTQPAMVVEA